MDIKVRLVRARDHQELFGRTWHYHGTNQILGAWGANDGRGLSFELANEIPILADEIAEELFAR